MSGQGTRRDGTPGARTRVPGAQRREELITAAVHEFARGGLHGTAVERIARRVGVAQPYVFSLFSNKRELFLAALERSFEKVAATFERAAADYREGRGPEGCNDTLARELCGAGPEELDDFFRHGMALNVAAALGVEDLSSGCEWVRAELEAGAPG
jgi:AcrR family transcriptional regulator